MKYLCFVIFIISGLSLFSNDKLLKDAKLPEAEFSTAINPLDSNNIVIAVQYGFNTESGFNLTIYYTKDFGNTWETSNFHGSHEENQPAGDPVLAFDASGNVLLVNLIIPNESGINAILSQSQDGGATWSLLSTIAAINTDKPWMAIDKFNSSPYKGNVYIPLVENHINLYSYSNNFQTKQSVEITDGVQLPSVVVKRDGTVFTSTVALNSQNILYVQEFSNGGTILVHSTEVVSFPDYTFNVPDISKRFQPTAYLAIDNSGGKYDGRLYLSYTASETKYQNYFNVFLTFSDDNGLTWSKPKIVHSDQRDKVQQFYSSIYVNSKGVVIIDWYDRKNYVNTNKLTDFFMGVSYDGGKNFSEIQLNSAPSDFEYVVPASENFGIGEYHQLVATENTALSFWSDGRTNDGDLNIYMAKVNINGLLNIEEHSMVTDQISISNLYPLPAKSNVYTKIKLKDPSNIKYEIYNSIGSKLSESNWINYPAGEQILNINTDLPTGAYVIEFKNDKGFLKSMKLIIN